MRNDADPIAAAIILALFLTPYVLIVGALAWQWAKETYENWRNERIDAGLDKLFRAHEERRASSSIGSEQLTLNQQVPGSSPGGLTTTPNELIKVDGEMRRRITWHLETRTAIAIFPSEVLPTIFKWRDLPRPVDESIIPQAGITRFRDFRPGEPQVQMIWDGSQCETFVDEIQLKMFIIRFVYNIDQIYLVPSEALADANLVYSTGDWVDEWFCTDRNDEVIECPRKIYRPEGRKIRFVNNIYRDSRPYLAPSTRFRGTVMGPTHSRGYEIPARVEIDRLSDEECFYAFKAGGFYGENQQVPPQDQAQETEEA